MTVSAIKHLERMRGSKVTCEEYHRLTMMQQALNLQDDDAVWMLFLAMEYQKAYYEQLPKKISDTTTELLKRVRETADREAANAQNRLIQSVIEQTEKLTARVHIMPLMPIYLLIILCLMAFGSMTYWAGLCAGLGKPLSLENVYYVPAGMVIEGMTLTAIAFCLGISFWKIAYDQKSWLTPMAVSLGLSGLMFAANKFL
ncbi:MAG: hypothetical protein IJY48_06395 [Mailhella sp.]|nr:hypothetical protein [Mailhella sp.]MBQ8743771.1 hypothetical protein [Mailhella sp.]MBQ9105736.1 hypothetical protein [Mailhella sp.]